MLDTGAGGLVRRRGGVPAGSVLAGTAQAGGELWFVLAGAGRLAFGDDTDASVRADCAAWLPPGTDYELLAGGTEVTLDCVILPADATGGEAGPPLVRELGECPVEVTGDRTFRVLFGPGRGCAAATQFAGEIPPGRAPEHTHPYDEVVLVLAGAGVCHTGAGDRPLAPGSCVHLPPGLPHCLENTGLENTGLATLRVLGVFHSGDSPAIKS